MSVEHPNDEQAPGDADWGDESASAIEPELAGGNGDDEDACDPEAELAAAKDQILRLQAEMDKLRKRTSKEVQTERRYGPLALMRELLPVVDNVDRAIEAAQQTVDAESLLEGFQLVRQQLMTVLDHHHCEMIAADGEEFDPAFHEAILQQPSADHQANFIMLVTQTGYKLYDRVIRPAQVIVSSGPPPT